MVGNANANGIPFLKRYGIPPAIKNAMVLWYDIARQGATNESMAENPILKDLSGNGHDIECFNFGWSGMSGIGGYMSDFTKGYHYNTKDESFEYITPTKFHFVKSFNTDGEIWKLKYIGGKIKLNVTGIPDDANFRIGTLINVINLQNGINILDISSVVDADSTYGFSLSRTGECDITVEQLPLYPNALVSDGVDDYAYVKGLPILTDYTVIAKRSYQGFEQNLQDNNIALAGKNTSGENGAFMLERLLKSGEYSEYNFGRYNGITLHNDIITYATKDSYNGVQKLNAGELPDTDTLLLFTKGRYNSTVQAALYSFLLFDRTLTTAEIEWVKKNMIEGGTEI